MNLNKFDLLWILISAGLVFFMQAGFLCLESGLTRSKNSINVAIKNITDFGIATLLFYSIGFGFMFGESVNGLIGSNDFFPSFSGTDPSIPVIFLFELMFCGTAATIVSGAVAERMKFGAYIIVTIIISSLIYPIYGHWAWGKDLGTWTIKYGWLYKLGFVDFAGSTVVHSVGGWVGLVAIIIIGPRKGRFDTDKRLQAITGHNLPIAMLGTIILWFGWIGFNGGSTFQFSNNIPAIISNTMLSAAAGLVSALIFGWIRLKYAEATLALNGALAGLVSITASCHAVSSPNSVIIGFISGILMLETRLLLEKLKLDDAVGAIPVHLIGGIWGTLAVGIFGNLNLLQTGLSRIDQIGIQTLGIISCGILCLSVGFILLFSINKFFRLRVSEVKEFQGLNYAEHRATTELLDLFSEMEYQRLTGDLSKDLTVEPFTEIGQIASRYNLVLHKIRENIQDKEKLTENLRENLNNLHMDLLTARKLQFSIMDDKDKLISNLLITTKYLPLTEVGGDFFDIYEVSPGVCRILLADTTGHGLKAALITIGVKTIYDSLKKGKYNVTEILFYLNNEFIESFENLNQFLTCIILDIDTNTNTVKYASAGHIPQYILNDGELIKMEKTGRLLGVLENAGHSSKSIKLKDNFQILLFTDGLIEEWNQDNEEFGEEKIEEYLLNNKNKGIKQNISELLNLQKEFLSGNSLHDDITIIGVEKNT